MKFRNLLTATTLAMLPLAAQAATLIVPVSGSGPGLAGSHWQTELTLQNTSSTAVTVQYVFRDATAHGPGREVTIAPRATTSLQDVVGELGVQGTGALVLTVDDAAVNRLAVNVRVTNAAPNGTFGQDVAVVPLQDATDVGQIVVLAAPSSASTVRFNFGLYAPADAQVRWELVRANGDVVGSQTRSYSAGTQVQYNAGIQTLLAATPQDNDSIHATVVSGRAVFYGSAIDNQTGDPTWVGPVPIRDEVRLDFLGIDLNEDGTVELHDADRDGVVDTRIELYTSFFPNFFRIITNTPGVHYEILDAQPDVTLIDDNGTVEWAPGSNVKGTDGVLHVRATAPNGTSAIYTIPVHFR